MSPVIPVECNGHVGHVFSCLCPSRPDLAVFSVLTRFKKRDPPLKYSFPGLLVLRLGARTGWCITGLLHRSINRASAGHMCRIGNVAHRVSAMHPPYRCPHTSWDCIHQDRIKMTQINQDHTIEA